MQRNLCVAILIAVFFMSSCTNEKNTRPPSNADSINHQKISNMQSFISIFEIPAANITRAIDFYEKILNLSIEKVDIPEMDMGILPYENQMVTVIIVKEEGFEPSAQGTTAYFNAGDDLQNVLDKVEMNNGKILVPKTPHADNNGFFALFLDSEGNRIGLHSPN